MTSGMGPTVHVAATTPAPAPAFGGAWPKIMRAPAAAPAAARALVDRSVANTPAPAPAFDGARPKIMRAPAPAAASAAACDLVDGICKNTPAPAAARPSLLPELLEVPPVVVSGRGIQCHLHVLTGLFNFLTKYLRTITFFRSS